MEALNSLLSSFDIVLSFGLLWLAWQALTSPDLFRGIVLFVAFGLLMALAWARLEAPDVALAEAAIGSGLTGALLLAALAHLQDVRPVMPHNKDDEPDIPNPSNNDPGKGLKSDTRKGNWLISPLLLLLATGLGYSLLSLSGQAEGLGKLVAHKMEMSGVSHPVTAVLLNFRGYDTLLEMVVLLLALLGAWSIGGPPFRTGADPGPVLKTLMRLLVPVLILVAAYLLWTGAYAPGGAFQAGSLLGAAGVLLLLAGWRFHPGKSPIPLRLALAAGPAVFIAVAILTMFKTGHLLEYPPAQAGILILIIETAATVSIGVTLAALFFGAEPEHKEKQ